MANKTIHFVFQVLNFLSLPFASQRFELSDDEKLLLLFLAKHKGAKGIYPSVTTLARELDKTDRTIRRTLLRLKEKGLLLISPVSGRSNFYNIMLPDLDLSTTPDAHVRGTQSPPLTPTSGHPCRPRQDTPDAHVSQSVRENNKKEIKQRGRKKRASPLSCDFEPSKSVVQKAKEIGLTQDEANYEFDKFINYYIEKGEEKNDWNKVLELWFMRAARHKAKHGAITVKKNEVKSTVGWYYPNENEFAKNRDDSRVRGTDTHVRGVRGIAELLNGLNQQANEHLKHNGAHTNGLGSQGTGEKKGN